MDNVNCMERCSNFHHPSSRRMFRGRSNRHRWCSRPTPKSAALMHKSRVALLLLPDTIVGYLSRAKSLTKGPSVFDAHDGSIFYGRAPLCYGPDSIRSFNLGGGGVTRLWLHHLHVFRLCRYCLWSMLLP